MLKRAGVAAQNPARLKLPAEPTRGRTASIQRRSQARHQDKKGKHATRKKPAGRSPDKVRGTEKGGEGFG